MSSEGTDARGGCVIVLKELEDMVKRFGTPRRTRIIRPDQIDDVSLEAMLDDPEGLTDEPCAVALTASGMVGREPVEGPKQATFGRHSPCPAALTDAPQICSGAR